MFGSKRTREYVYMLHDKEDNPKIKEELLEELKKFDSPSVEATQQSGKDTKKSNIDKIIQKETFIRVYEKEIEKLTGDIQIYNKALISPYLNEDTEKLKQVINQKEELIKTNNRLISKLREEVAQMKKPASNGGRSTRRHKKKRDKKANSYRRTRRRHKKKERQKSK